MLSCLLKRIFRTFTQNYQRRRLTTTSYVSLDHFIACTVTNLANTGKKRIRKMLSTLIYFRRHVIYGQDIDFLLPGFTVLQDGVHEQRRLIITDQSKFQTTVLRFVLNTVTRVREEKLKEDPPDDILDMSQPERRCLLTTLYKRNPKKLALGIWGPVGKVVDFEAIYNPPDSASDEVKAVLRAWERSLWLRWMFAGEAAINFRLRWKAEEKRKTLDFVALGSKKPDTFAFEQWRGLPVEPVFNFMPGAGKILVLSDRGYFTDRSSTTPATSTIPAELVDVDDDGTVRVKADVTLQMRTTDPAGQIAQQLHEQHEDGQDGAQNGGA